MFLKEAWKMIHELPTNLFLIKEETKMMRRIIALLAIFGVLTVFVVTRAESVDSVQSEANIGLGVYKLTKREVASTAVGGFTAGGLAWLGARIGMKIGGLVGGFLGAAIGGGIGAL